jgi:ribonuclease P protein component
VQRKFRLTRSEDFDRVRRNGKSYAHPLVVLVAWHNGLQQMRVGVTAGKTVGTAVDRNRAKRLMREAVRAMLPILAPGWDLILIARPALAGASLAEACSAVTGLLRRARIFPADES